MPRARVRKDPLFLAAVGARVAKLTAVGTRAWLFSAPHIVDWLPAQPFDHCRVEVLCHRSRWTQ